MMSVKPLATLLLASLVVSPLLAQATVPAADPAMAAKGYADPASPNESAINAREAPVTAGLNGEVAATTGAAVQMNADAQAQYEHDRAEYMSALVRHDAAVDRTDIRYARQQRAYADAMSAWRTQVQACKRGHQRACDMPPPNVQDYY